MVKVGPSANYRVRVRPYVWDDPGRPELVEGIIDLSLQLYVSITFVPDVSDLAPPWTGDGLPPIDQGLSTPAQARLYQALTASYVVTPHETLAGTSERFTFTWPGDEPGDPTTVFYVTPAEFDRYAADLVALSDVAGSLHSAVTVDQVRDHEVIQFVESRIVDSPWLLPRDRAMLGR
jgi:hypothetical protein